MAKMLDALERARQERLKKMQSPGSEVEAEAEAAPTTSPIAAPLDEPVVRPSAAAKLRAEGGNAPRPSRAANFHPSISELIIGVHDNQSPIAEQMRQIRTNLETVLSDHRSRTILVSSPVSGDGKTLVAANLAAVLADDPEQQVLIIDADMRKSELHRLFGIKPTPGLSEYLRGACPLSAAIQATSIPNLKIIPAGHKPDKPTVLLNSDAMMSLIGELQRTYRWIIFDTPPLLPVTDALVLGRGCVGLILVVRLGQTSRQVIERAQDLLAEGHLPVLGCILNDFNDKGRADAYYYKYYQRQSAFGGDSA